MQDRVYELNKKKVAIRGLPHNGNQCFVAVDKFGELHTKCSGFENACPFKTEFDEESMFCYYHRSSESEQNQCENADAFNDALKNAQNY